ncbi:MAG: ATP-binding protein [Acidimicrobiales bacterium]
MDDFERSEDLTGAVKEQAADAVRLTEEAVGPVELTVPARSEHLRVLRLVTASVAASLELDVDHLDDLRIAIDELCGGLIEHAAEGAHLGLSLVGHPHCLEAQGLIVEGGPGAEVDPISRLILDGLDISWEISEKTAAFRLVAPRSGRP